MIRRLLITALAFLGFAFGAAAFAGEKPIYTGEDNLAVGGYDTVAYHTVGHPVKGSADFHTEWNGAVWHFSSEENLNLFKGNPAKYAPRYGGYCAWATANDKVAPGNPELWALVDGRLYLNYNEYVVGLWNKDIPGFITAADEGYPHLTTGELY